MINTPSPTADNGDRGPNGQFLPGNRVAKGNPYAKRIGELRSALMAAITDADWQAVIRKLIDDAIAGDKAARAELLDRTLGRPLEADLIERIEALEARLQEQRR